MRKIYVILCLLLAGCAATNKNSATLQKLLINTGNTSELIFAYKEHLSQHPDDHQVIYQLVKVYMEVDDYESASFYMNVLLKKNNVKITEEYLLTTGKIYLQLDVLNFAKAYVLRAYRMNNTNRDTLNMLGIISAMEGQYGVARQRFEAARMAMADDVKIKNNLAIVDILEKKYDKAYERLIPLVNKKEVSSQVKVTMAIALAKLERRNLFDQLMKGEKPSQVDELYAHLSNAEFKYIKDIVHYTSN
ncbi:MULTISPECIES: tetratricopeptide repeat protein [Vibrio]|uniref:tetratricopeptide repeat protein n=1 Tax=Vibrio TaxID=662 RepID=UPI001868E1F0|nr:MULTISPECIES: hypothetical protein [Vibrio]MBE3666219.1 hypothetical protein [Vibrio navarrensis]MBE4579474.1 hypothetical protein [Vibrio navarrensis]MBN8105313.1 hypothetical protein [Vibrio vulnificus]